MKATGAANKKMVPREPILVTSSIVQNDLSRLEKWEFENCKRIHETGLFCLVQVSLRWVSFHLFYTLLFITSCATADHDTALQGSLASVTRHPSKDECLQCLLFSLGLNHKWRHNCSKINSKEHITLSGFLREHKWEGTYRDVGVPPPFGPYIKSLWPAGWGLPCGYVDAANFPSSPPCMYSSLSLMLCAIKAEVVGSDWESRESSDPFYLY